MKYISWEYSATDDSLYRLGELVKTPVVQLSGPSGSEVAQQTGIESYAALAKDFSCKFDFC